MSSFKSLLAAAAAVALVTATPSAQDAPTPNSPESPKEFKALKYRSIGPAPAGGCRGSRACRAIRSPTTPPRRRAASGSRPTAARPGSRSSTTSRSPRSARSPSPRPTRTSSTSARGEANIRGNVAAGQRHLQVHRRRQDLEARLEAGRPDRHDGRPSEEPRHRLRRRARPRLRPQPGARRLPHHRRRQDLAAGAVEGRRHRRLRRRASTRHNPQHPLRRPLADAAPAVGADQRRPGQRPVRLARRRRHLEARSSRQNGPARRHLGQGRRRVAPVRRPARLRPDRGREGRPVPLRRRRRHLEAGQRRPRACASGPGTTRRSPSIRPTPTWSGARRCRCSRASTAARRFSTSRGCTTATITTSGSTRRTRSG